MSQRITDKILQGQIAMLANAMDCPVEWFHLGGSYGNTNLELRVIDPKSKELTTGTYRLYTGTKGGLSNAISFMLEVRYQLRRNRERLEERNQI